MAIPQDWKPLIFGTKASYRQERDVAQMLEGPAALTLDTVGSGANNFVALVRRSGSFGAKVRDSVHCFWVKPASGNDHYAGLMLRCQSAAASPDGVTTADVSGVPSYFVRVNRFAQIEVMRGGVTTAQPKLYPSGSGVIAPALAALSGGYYYRARLANDASGNPEFTISQTVNAAAAADDEGNWTTLAAFADADAGKIAEAGYAGIVLLNGGVNAQRWRVDRYRDLKLG